jgi:hypothetical protein
VETANLTYTGEWAWKAISDRAIHTGTATKKKAKETLDSGPN